MRPLAEELAAIVAQDCNLKLVTVVCPKCKVTAGILPVSIAWHSRCGGVRMVPTDPEAAARMAKQAGQRRRMRDYMRRRRDRAKHLTNGAKTGRLDGSAEAPRPEGIP
jgi:hypothetical protein